MKINKFSILLVVLFYVLIALGSGSPQDSKPSNANAQNPNHATIRKTDDKKKEIPTINEGVIFDELGIRITTKEISDGFMGQNLKVLIENNSDKEITVSADALAVNGFMVTDFLYETLTPGTKSNTNISCLNSSLQKAGITEITEIAIWFKLVDPLSYTTIYEAFEPSIIRTSAYDSITPIDIEGVEIVNQGGIKLVAKYVDNNSFWGSSVLIYAENNSGKDVTVYAENVSVNGFMTNGYYSETLKNGYCSFDTLEIFESDLKENGIENIEEIRMSFKCFNASTFSDIFRTDNITISVSN